MIEYTSRNIRTWSMLGSCGAFGIAAMELPNIDDRCIVLTSDLCTYSSLDRFKTKYPDRFFNVGIAEQNMVGIAGGLAKENFIPFATTYATFAATRCADQVRVNMGYMKLGIKLVGLTAGLSVGILGATHMSVEDIAVMRAIPNIVILSPADCMESIKAVIASAEIESPVYLRLSGTMNNPIVYKEDYNFEIGKAITLREGDDVVIIATGTMVYNSCRAAELLEEKGVSCRVIDMHTIKPLDENEVQKACNAKLIVTVEEHSMIGGLGGAVAECLAGMNRHPPLLRVGLPDIFMHAGTYEHLVEKCGLCPPSISDSIFQYLQSEHCNR
ncbi:MAG: transketolase [Candidatus Cloacimonetes bacterium]|nr:transketolase [Candidatus Cloacimonadota bacterium]